MKGLAWLQLLSRSAYTFQLAVMCSRETFAVIILFCALQATWLCNVFSGFVGCNFSGFRLSWYISRASVRRIYVCFYVLDDDQVNYYVWMLAPKRLSSNDLTAGD
jgi:hypothetical protein